MTAKELIEKAWRKDLYVYVYTDAEMKAMYEVLCREQREICADETDKNAVIDETVKPRQIFVDKEDVLNAEIPEI